MTTKNPRIICFGLTLESLEPIQKSFTVKDTLHLPLDRENIVLAKSKSTGSMILCGTPSFSPLEAAQLLRMQFQNSEIFYLGTEKNGFNRLELINNGFSDAFIIPEDWGQIVSKVDEVIINFSNDKASYQTVSLIDIQVNTILNFDTSIYLPTNQKFVKLSTAGDSLDQKRIDKLKNRQMNDIFVPLDQLPLFYKYTAERLRDMGSAVEREEPRNEAVRNLIYAAFETPRTGLEKENALSRDSSEIVKSYVDQSRGFGWYNQLIRFVEEKGDLSSHGSNVSIFATLFSMGTGVGNPEELGIAGLLHDIGICDLPEELQLKTDREMTPDERALYQTHPDLAVKALKERNFTLSDNIYKIILQHHEKYNGKGYPEGLSGSQISEEAQLLSIADRFDYLTTTKFGKSRMTPGEAAAVFTKERAQDKSTHDINPELMFKVLNLLFKK